MSVCGGILGGLVWIGSLWLSLVGSRVVPLVYPPLELRQVYALALGTVAALGWVGCGAITLGCTVGFSLGAGWVWWGRKMLRIRVRASNRSFAHVVAIFSLVGAVGIAARVIGTTLGL